MSEVVLDASAILAAILGERGEEVIARLEAGALVSTVNYAEVLTRLYDLGVTHDVAERSLDLLELRIVPFDIEHAGLSAELRPATRSTGLSLGDRACLALAKAQNAIAYTADQVWANLDISVEIRVIR